MAKKGARKPSGAAGMAVIDETADDLPYEGNGSAESPAIASKPERKAKPKDEKASVESFGVSDIKKAAAFVNSVGGLDKAIAVLQILKVAKEVQ